jgi:hypothetical protein
MREIEVMKSVKNSTFESRVFVDIENINAITLFTLTFGT